MRCVALAAYLAATCMGASALAAPCPGNRDALGTTRVLAVDSAKYSRLGTNQYPSQPQLPLAEHEVVLTFDDGPQPPYTDSILKTLAAECVKATFFMVGRQASQSPEAARRVLAAGHSIGTHSQNHPLVFDRVPLASAQREIDDGIASVSAALGNPNAVAPFFRIPGLLRVAPVEDYLNSRGISVWSVDADADDWYRTATPESVVQKALSRLGQKGRGILLLHDNQPVTALALPILLRKLKTRGYRIVQVVPEDTARQRVAVAAIKQPSQIEPQQVDRYGWPRLVRAEPQDVEWNGREREMRPQRLRRPPPDRYEARRHEWRRIRTADGGWFYVPR
jgi:peptidoglycan/xylan/chitin deacetylase (PgdA/CDA1 family)